MLCMDLTNNIEMLMKNHECLFGYKPKTTVHSPFERGDHPEIDNSDFCRRHSKFSQSLDHCNGQSP